MTKITLDMLDKDSVSILTQHYDENNNQVGSNVRCAYMNTAEQREQLKSELPEDKWKELISVWGDVPTREEPKIDEPVITIDMQKSKLISSMSTQCNLNITEGFDMELEDGQVHHFSLELTDQLKIQALALKAKSGEIILPYHADSEPCRFYSVHEILNLNTKMEQIIEYQTTYFNSLRDYINSMTTIEELDTVTYGMEIPVEYQSEVLKALMSDVA